MDRIRMAIVGVGKIVRDQHAPVIARDADFELVATASPNSSLDGVPAFKTLDELLASGIDVHAVAVCTTTQVRHDIARQALAAGKAVLLEKPPAATVSQVDELAAIARERDLALFASWHSRHAPMVETARAWLAAHPPATIAVTWKEDVRRWHPGQDWIWQAAGLGVFDPGINALSILTRIAPNRVFLNAARLSVPSGRLNPIAATLNMADGEGAKITADFDWRQTGEQTWEIAVEAKDGGRLRLYEGGAKLDLDGAPASAPPDDPHDEYAGVYTRFAQLARSNAIEVDTAPLQIAADAFLIGDRETVEPFED